MTQNPYNYKRLLCTQIVGAVFVETGRHNVLIPVSNGTSVVDV